ncbi:MAG TPA: hypothetical protein VK612_10460 [Pyrinomonadaceae bacterium]|nr:hypothetical protein [Pyrinomonadaceae bacterium]
MNDDLLTNQYFVVDDNHNVSLLDQFTRCTEGGRGQQYFRTSEGKDCHRLDIQTFFILESGEILTIANSRKRPRD